MPIYEYRCSACDHKFEALQKFSDAPLVTCPVCAQDALAKLVSAAGFQLKGSGWYQTDFKSGGTKPAGKSDTAEAKPADAPPSSGAAADPAPAKAEAKAPTGGAPAA
ncbi:MAG: zinc ribbon domain-containing protein [Burkholderiales bacterium]